MNPNTKEGELKLFLFLPMYMNIGSFLVKVKRYIGNFLLFQFNGQVGHTVYLCLPQAVRQTESLNGRQVGLIMIQRTTIMRTSGQIFSTCLGTFQRMVFSRNSAWKKVIMETVAAKFGPKENTAFIRKVREFLKYPSRVFRTCLIMYSIVQSQNNICL